MVFVDRLLATLVHLRHGAAHDVLACWFGVGRSRLHRRTLSSLTPSIRAISAPERP
ncbi:transposase family protein [Streptomyces cinereoruber]|uniref:transposase family protein n=1 Tax=Streptomyces cinereoruber TaxID=67260 RepID=UPI003625EE52